MFGQFFLSHLLPPGILSGLALDTSNLGYHPGPDCKDCNPNLSVIHPATKGPDPWPTTTCCVFVLLHDAYWPDSWWL